jgi:hypothetical protein
MRLANELYKQGYRKQSEVIDEFAERLKKRLYDKPSIFTQQRYIVNDEIDNLVEEMKGGVTAESAIKAVQEAAHKLKDTPLDDLLGIGSTMQL